MPRQLFSNDFARAIFGALLSLAISNRAAAWGAEGHEVVALIAQNYLSPTAKQAVDAILKTDKCTLMEHDIASEAVWADKYRDSDRDTTHIHYNQTHLWHFINLEIDNPNLDTTCYGHPPLASGKQASAGPAKNCTTDKINQFVAELKKSSTTSSERLMALQFVLHFVGDLHQPLHAADANDEGGNKKVVFIGTSKYGSLHGLWDTKLVENIGKKPADVAQQLIAATSATQVQQWTQGTPEQWAQESFDIAKISIYQKLPTPLADGSYHFTAAQISALQPIAAEQLTKAGVRLAALLNNTLH